ncbi:MAG TPA: histidine triad nucleotide-binding protein [Candidatus Krumholzibacteria bacterium]|nr:histidine triad nucleotide-binding protein [Candidatus Krumholzibacteria bacterium]
MIDCIFCRIVAGEIPATRVFEDADTIAFRDIHPAAPTHLLVIPKRHIASLEDVTGADCGILGRMLWNAQRAARAEGLADGGYRLVMNVGENAGQAVPHVHLHVLGGRPFSWPPG